jgi:endoglucanase
MIRQRVSLHYNVLTFTNHNRQRGTDMSKKFVIVVLCCLFICLVVSLPAPARDTLPHLGRGINLGNKLESPRGQPWGPLLEAWNFVRIKDGGFDSVRLPIRWHEYAADTPPYTIEAEFFEHVEWAIQQALDNDLAITFNMHHYEPLFAKPYQEKDKFLAMWRQIAERFKDLPNDTVVFEILNEPHASLTASLWNQFLREAHAIIRESNPDRYIMIGSAEWGGLTGMNKLDLPDDDKLIFTVHYYEPFQFTHQGAEWNTGADAWCGTRWTATDAQQAFIRRRLDEVAQWAQARNNVHVFLGEFGVYKKCAEPEDQARWVDFVARESEQRGFSWGYWEFNAGFGAYGPREADGWNYLHHALIPEAEPQPMPTAVPRPTAAPIVPGENMLKNGDFSAGADNWWHYVHENEGAQATVTITDHALISIAAGGSQNWHVQFGQLGVALETGRTYAVSFDARVNLNYSYTRQVRPEIARETREIREKFFTRVFSRISRVSRANGLVTNNPG